MEELELSKTLDKPHITPSKNKKSRSQKLRMPNLFIVGAAKAGSTTLWYLLKQHPDILLPEEEYYKEPAFFSPTGNLGKYSLKEYLKLYKGGVKDVKFIGDASAAYLADPESAPLIHACAPKAKIIIILRNPVDRAYSLYNWMSQEGYEWAPSFKAALQLEKWRSKRNLPSLLHPQPLQCYQYLQSGKYAEQVKRYIDLFGVENIHIVRFADLKTHPKKTLKNILDFLKLEPFQPEFESLNPSKRTRSNVVQFGLRFFVTLKLVFQKRILGKKSFSKTKRDEILQYGIIEEKPPKLPTNLRKKLLDTYRKDIEELGKMTGEDFSGWLQEPR